jgi:hypothetical protein
LNYTRVTWRAFSHDRSSAGVLRFSKPVMRKGMKQKDHALFECPAAIRPLDVTGKVPVT